MSDKKTILITGCSSGIGYDAAHGLNKRGWRVFATCRKQEDCERLESEGLESFVLDYTDETTIASAVDETLSRTGGTLGAVFNNGAIAVPGLLEDIPTQALRENFEVNFFAQHDLTRRLLPVFRQQGHGRILMNSSVLGFAALPWRGSYNSTKFAMEGWADTLRLELTGTGIHVVLIEPGPITTRIRQNSQPHYEKWRALSCDQTDQSHRRSKAHPADATDGQSAFKSLTPSLLQSNALGDPQRSLAT